MKKIISISLLIIIISGIFFPKYTFAYKDSEKSKFDDIGINKDTYMKDIEDGKSKIGNGNKEQSYKISEGTQNSVIKNVVKFFNVIPSTVRFVLYIITENGSSAEVNQEYGKGFSIQKLVFNKIDLLNIDFFTTDSADTEIESILKDNIANVFYGLRNIAIVANLAILIYAGIRIAIASVAIEKAKYKKMLVSWVSSFAILMILPYIMIIISAISRVLCTLCEQIMISLCGNEIINIEDNLFSSATTSTNKGFSILIPTLIYWILTFYQLKFFWIYAKRLFNVGFLIVISPLVLVLYSFDKVGDGEASSFKMWLNEYALNLMIQPLHALLYTIFMVIASNIMQEAPLLAVLFLTSLSRGERVLRNILRVKNSITVQSMSDNASVKSLSKVGS